MDLSKRISKTRFSRASSIAVVLIALGFAIGWSQPKEAGDEIMPTLGLKSGELVTIAQDQAEKSEMAITMNGQDYTIDYTFQSNRSKQFRLLVQQENGKLVEQTAPTASTIRGTLRGLYQISKRQETTEHFKRVGSPFLLYSKTLAISGPFTMSVDTAAPHY